MAGGGGKHRRNRKGKGKGSGNGSKGTASGSGQASGNDSKRSSKPLECYTCGGPHMARECPKRFRADQASAPSSADEPSTSGTGHLEQSCACHAIGADMITELESLSGCAFSDLHASGRKHVLISDPKGDIYCELVLYLREKLQNMSSMSAVVIAPEHKRRARALFKGMQCIKVIPKGTPFLPVT